MAQIALYTNEVKCMLSTVSKTYTRFSGYLIHQISIFFHQFQGIAITDINGLTLCYGIRTCQRVKINWTDGPA